MLTISALYVEGCSFRGEGGGANDDAGYSNKMGNVCCVEIADGYMRDGGMKEELMLWKGDFVEFLRGEDDSVGALFQSGFKLGFISI